MQTTLFLIKIYVNRVKSNFELKLQNTEEDDSQKFSFSQNKKPTGIWSLISTKFSESHIFGHMFFFRIGFIAT